MFGKHGILQLFNIPQVSLLDTELAVLQLAFKRSQMFPTSGNDPFEHKHKLGHAAMDYEAHAFEAAARSATTSRD